MVPSSLMGCLVFVRASLFMIALGCIYGPGHFMPVPPRSVRALTTCKIEPQKFTFLREGGSGPVSQIFHSLLDIQLSVRSLGEKCNQLRAAISLGNVFWCT